MNEYKADFKYVDPYYRDISVFGVIALAVGVVLMISSTMLIALNFISFLIALLFGCLFFLAGICTIRKSREERKRMTRIIRDVTLTFKDEE